MKKFNMIIASLVVIVGMMFMMDTVSAEEAIEKVDEVVEVVEEEKEVEKSDISLGKDDNVIGEEIHNNLGTVHFRKVDSETKELLDGGKFVFGSVELDAEEEFVTVNGEKSFSGLPQGEYYIQEVEAPEGYEIFEERIYFTIGHGENEKMLFEIELENDKIEEEVLYSILVNKMDEDTKDLLPGVKFSLRNKETEEVFEGTTDENGEILFENLPEGIYELVEEEALEGYHLLEEALEIVVNEETAGESKTVVASVFNKKIEEPEIPEVEEPEEPETPEEPEVEEPVEPEEPEVEEPVVPEEPEVEEPVVPEEPEVEEPVVPEEPIVEEPEVPFIEEPEILGVERPKPEILGEETEVDVVEITETVEFITETVEVLPPTGMGMNRAPIAMVLLGLGLILVSKAKKEEN